MAGIRSNPQTFLDHNNPQQMRPDTHTHMCLMGTVALMETIMATIVIYCTMIYCMHL